MSNPNPLPDPVPAPRWFVLAGLLALFVYGFFIGINSTVAAGGSDSSGYLNSARLFAAGRLTTEVRIPAEFGPVTELNRLHFTPFGFYPTLEGTQVPPTYPPGVPLQFAAASKLLGWGFGPMAVEIGCALAAVWLCYLAARELQLSPYLAATGAAVLACCPIFIFTSLQPLSDTPATTWGLAAIVCALRARRHLGWIVACGVTFSVAVMVRPTNAVLFPAIVVFIGFEWRRLALLTASGVPGAACLGTYNYTLYGHPALSGYGGTIFQAFDSVYVADALVDFAKWLGLLMPSVLLIFPLAVPFAGEYRNRTVAAITVWFGAVIALFACCAFSHESWWSLRYLLPAVPALILASLLGLEVLARWVPPPRRLLLITATATVVVVWAAVVSVYWTRKFAVFYTRDYENLYADASTAAKKHFPANALVVTSHFCGALYAYTNFPILRSDLIGPTEFARFSSSSAQSGRPICALLFEFEEQEALRDRCPGEWTRVSRMKNASFWHYKGPTAVPAVK